MFTAFFIIFLAICILPYKEHLSDTCRGFYRAGIYSKLIVLLTPLSVYLIFSPDTLSRSFLPVAYLYALIAFIYQGYRLCQVKRERRWKSFMARPCLWIYSCVFLILMTPLCDLFLGRTYPSAATVVVISSTFAVLGLHLVENFLRQPRQLK